MTVSLSQPPSRFEGVRLKHVKVLVGLVSSAGVIEVDHLRRRYAEQASHFDATLGLLSTFGWVRQDGARLSLGTGISSAAVDAADVATTLLRRAFHARLYRAEVVDYLKRFRIVDGLAVHCPSAEQRTSESALRNFMMDLGVLSYDGASDSYRLEPEYNGFFFEATRSGAAVSPSAVGKHLEARSALGMDAEIEILAFERRRLGERCSEKVVHISRIDASAGYDIQSVTLESDVSESPRLIEVKAVPSDTLRFFWSANEVAAAERLGSWYYLYLLPVGTDGGFDIRALRIVQDPANVIFGDQSDWITATEVFRCELPGGERKQ